MSAVLLLLLQLRTRFLRVCRTSVELILQYVRSESNLKANLKPDVI